MSYPIIAFDFSMNKPAMCIYDAGNDSDNPISYYAWPAKLDEASVGKLRAQGVIVCPRDIDPIKDGTQDEHSLIYLHVARATELAERIVCDIVGFLESREIGKEEYRNVIIANEGFSFASNGDATLDLAGYKYILMYKLIEAGFTNLKTYAPITIKSVAGCAKKGMGKAEMIEAAGNAGRQAHPFNRAIICDPASLKKKTAFVPCVDDLCDAFWCMVTVLKKENIKCALNAI